MPNRPPTGNTNFLPLPMDEAVWRKIAAELLLPPQQMRIVELILRGGQDKQIAAELDIAFSTLRSHLERIYRRLQVSSSKDIILLVFRMAQNQKVCPWCGQ